jgi:hypothetical protein
MSYAANRIAFSWYIDSRQYLVNKDPVFLAAHDGIQFYSLFGPDLPATPVKFTITATLKQPTVLGKPLSPTPPGDIYTCNVQTIHIGPGSDHAESPLLIKEGTRTITINLPGGGTAKVPMPAYLMIDDCGEIRMDEFEFVNFAGKKLKLLGALTATFEVNIISAIEPTPGGKLGTAHNITMGPPFTLNNFVHILQDGKDGIAGPGYAIPGTASSSDTLMDNFPDGPPSPLPNNTLGCESFPPYIALCSTDVANFTTVVVRAFMPDHGGDEANHLFLNALFKSQAIYVQNKGALARLYGSVGKAQSKVIAGYCQVDFDNYNSLGIPIVDLILI